MRIYLKKVHVISCCQDYFALLSAAVDKLFERWCHWLLSYLAGNKVDLEHSYFWNPYQPGDVKFILFGEWRRLCINVTLKEYAWVKVKYGKLDVSSTSKGKPGWIDMRKEKNPLELWNDNFMSVWLHERPDVVLIQIRYDKIWQTLTSFTLYHRCDSVDQRHNLRGETKNWDCVGSPAEALPERQKHHFPEEWRNFAWEWLCCCP